MQIFEKKQEYFLTKAQYENLKNNGLLISGAIYNITDEDLRDTLGTAVRNNCFNVSAIQTASGTTNYQENVVCMNDCETFDEIVELQKANPYKTLYGFIGEKTPQSNNNEFPLKTLLQNPTGFANYTMVFISSYFSTATSDKRGEASPILEVYAIGEYIGKLARGYIFPSGSSGSALPKSPVFSFTGWTVLK